MTRLLSGTTPELGRGPRKDVKTVAEVDALLADAKDIPIASRAVARSLGLLWHDHWDTAHTIVQDLPDANASYVHGIIHRREPDYWNAKYWFRRVNSHPTWPLLAGEVRALRESTTEYRAFELGGSPGHWDAAAFADFCEAAARLPADHPQHRFAREVQAVELRCLWKHLTAK
jgi:hypothetical protein